MSEEIKIIKKFTHEEFLQLHLEINKIIVEYMKVNDKISIDGFLFHYAQSQEEYKFLHEGALIGTMLMVNQLKQRGIDLQELMKNELSKNL